MRNRGKTGSRSGQWASAGHGADIHMTDDANAIKMFKRKLGQFMDEEGKW